VAAPFVVGVPMSRSGSEYFVGGPESMHRSDVVVALVGRAVGKGTSDEISSNHVEGGCLPVFFVCDVVPDLVVVVGMKKSSLDIGEDWDTV